MKATSGPAQRGVTSRSLYGLRLPGVRLEDGAASGIRRGARGGLELRPGRGAAYATSSIPGSRPFFSCGSRHVAAQPPARSASDLPQLAVMISIEGCLKASRDLSMETPNMDCEHRVLPGTRPQRFGAWLHDARFEPLWLQGLCVVEGGPEELPPLAERLPARAGAFGRSFWRRSS